MSPAFAHPPVTQWHQRADGQHQRIPLKSGGGLVDEGTNSRILFAVEEVSEHSVKTSARSSAN